MGVLELWKGFASHLPARVSIPGRDLGVLERSGLRPETRLQVFQSLEGIWGFWNLKEDEFRLKDYEVSIPGRDLGVLELQQSRRSMPCS